MHIPDGILSPPVLAIGAIATASGLGVALRRLDADSMPRVAVFAAAFFVASLISFPLGPTSVHLLLGGLMGLFLGLATIPAVFIGLLLQAALFGFGGIIALGVNTMNIAGPALATGLIARPLLARAGSPGAAMVIGGLAGCLATAGTLLLVILVLLMSDPAYRASAHIVMITGAPLIIGETIATALIVAFLFRTRPELLTQRVTRHA